MRPSSRSSDRRRRRRPRRGLGCTPPSQADVAAFAEPDQPVVGERLPGAGLDQCAFVLHGLADEQAHALVGRQLPPEFLEHVAQHAVGDALAVDEHPVAVEEDGIKTHSATP